MVYDNKPYSERHKGRLLTKEQKPDGTLRTRYSTTSKPYGVYPGYVTTKCAKTGRIISIEKDNKGP